MATIGREYYWVINLIVARGDSSMFGPVRESSPEWRERQNEYGLRADTTASSGAGHGHDEPLLDIGDPHVRSLLTLLFSEHEVHAMTTQAFGRHEGTTPSEELTVERPVFGAKIDGGLRRSLRISSRSVDELRLSCTSSLGHESESESVSDDVSLPAESSVSSGLTEPTKRVLSLNRGSVLRRERRAKMAPTQLTRERELTRLRAVIFRRRRKRAALDAARVKAKSIRTQSRAFKPLEHNESNAR